MSRVILGEMGIGVVAFGAILWFFRGFLEFIWGFGEFMGMLISV